eukprot:6213365-Pleurochrysis_carterae.AAC.7
MGDASEKADLPDIRIPAIATPRAEGSGPNVPNLRVGSCGSQPGRGQSTEGAFGGGGTSRQTTEFAVAQPAFATTSCESCADAVLSSARTAARLEPDLSTCVSAREGSSPTTTADTPRSSRGSPAGGVRAQQLAAARALAEHRASTGLTPRSARGGSGLASARGKASPARASMIPSCSSPSPRQSAARAATYAGFPGSTGVRAQQQSDCDSRGSSPAPQEGRAGSPTVPRLQLNAGCAAPRRDGTAVASGGSACTHAAAAHGLPEPERSAQSALAYAPQRAHAPPSAQQHQDVEFEGAWDTVGVEEGDGTEGGAQRDRTCWARAHSTVRPNPSCCSLPPSAVALFEYIEDVCVHAFIRGRVHAFIRGRVHAFIRGRVDTFIRGRVHLGADVRIGAWT